MYIKTCILESRCALTQVWDLATASKTVGIPVMGALEVDCNMLLVHLYYSPQAYLIYHVHTRLGPKKFLDNIQVATFTGQHQGGSSS